MHSQLHSALPPAPAPLVDRMHSLVCAWNDSSDQRAVFLDCYLLMTRNMLEANAGLRFLDPPWVDRLLARFAEYYFSALELWEAEPTAAPRVWQAAHDGCGCELSPVQNLLLGVNAHINYDLVLTLAEMLRPEWAELTPEARSRRHVDYCTVDAVIAATIDSVQDAVLEPRMEVLRAVDVIMGPLDEHLISLLITGWRDNVWRHALRLLEAQSAAEVDALVNKVEVDALRIAATIGRLRLPGA